MRFRIPLLLFLSFFLFLRPAGADDAVSFNRDIRPILSENCFQCHGPDPKTREADLRLDTHAGAIVDSEAIVPGDANASMVIEMITSDDEDLRMPPYDSGKRLTAEQIELLRRWIEEGASYQLHWSFEPVRRPPLPPVKNTDWARNAIDFFVLQRLDAHGLEPSPTADPHTLIRRLYLDLLGLPPTIDEVDAFVNDSQPDAYERLLDRVLASPRFGERWGRHWLDQARYADSHGYTNDNERVMWPYRDWVINAMNQDLPFDQFTTQQLAGDLLPTPTLDQLVATGFHRNTLINTEGGAKPDQFRDEQVKDRVDTTGGVWLGLTVGCAKCHTHKFDPISQQEYFQLYSFFNSTADNNSTTPTVRVPSATQQRRLRELDQRHAMLTYQLNNDPDRRQRQESWEAQLAKQAAADSQDDEGQNEAIWTVLELDGKSDQDATFQQLEDKSLLVSGANVANDEFRITARSPLTTIRSVRLEAMTHDKLPNRGPGRAGNGNFVLSEIWFRTGDGRELRFHKAQADHSQPKYDVAGAIDGRENTGWAINSSPEGGPNHNRTAWFVLPQTLEVEENHALVFSLQFNNGASAYNLGRMRLSISADEWLDRPTANELAALAIIPADRRSKPQRERLEQAFLNSDTKAGPLYRELQSVTKQREQLTSNIPATMIMRELDTPRLSHVHIRGDFLRPGDAVDATVPAVLPPLPVANQRRTRLDLAQWLTQPDNPLTPRVRMNRMWMRLFGTGLVETENDFGTQGTLPTHPELLDWLGSEFVHNQWSTKQMLRLIADSATYRQSSRVRPAADAADPSNSLLWRQNRVRVEGEIVRDLGLAVSGLLTGKLGGPSVYPPQPEGVYAFTQRQMNWRTSSGEDCYRRGMYTFFYRSAPYPMLTTFDAPNFNQTCTRRIRSDTPLQALTVANSETIVEMTQHLARRVLLETPEDYSETDRVAFLFRLCFARQPASAELAYLNTYLSGQRQYFAGRLEAARAVAPAALSNDVSIADAAAWVATARVLVNLDEFITRE